MAKNKWLKASVTADAATVITSLFDEAQRRDPAHERVWIALVDGNNHQIDRIKAEAEARKLPVPIRCDFVHVLEYLWKAAWCFHDEGEPAPNAGSTTKPQPYSTAKRPRWQARSAAPPPTAGSTKPPSGRRRLRDLPDHQEPVPGLPHRAQQRLAIATGVIEGACRHLVKDRMDITGARWALTGAEAILKLRALRSNGDFDAYWQFHKAQERRRVHESRYLHGAIPRAA